MSENNLEKVFPFIKLFKTHKCCYIYDVNQNYFYKISKELYDFF